MREWRRALPALAGIPVAVAVAVAILLATNGAGKVCCARPTSTSASGWILPSLSSSGSAVALTDFRGHPVVVDLFASWCSACRDELPEFLALSKRVPQVRFVGVDSEDDGDGLAMARQYGITAWPLAADVGGSQNDGLHQALTTVPGMPITALYDASGRLVHVEVGAETGDALAAQLQQYFGVSPS